MPITTMRAIILAAGLGSRVREYTADKPKCLLDFGGKTLLQRQLGSLAANGITDIHLVRGYLSEKIAYEGITYHENPDFRDNNILNSLFYAEIALEGNVIVAYSDILFSPEIVEQLLKSDHDISIVVDIDWRRYYLGRKEHPIEEAEIVVLDTQNNVVRIGKHLALEGDVHGEFIGMMKVNSRGAKILKSSFYRAKSLYWDKPFHRAPVFQRAHLTDMIQEMTNEGIPIQCVIIEGGWKEIDTVEDYEKALEDFTERDERRDGTGTEEGY
jgi:L-glutamine-phosphate cytidylyltransferase